MIQDDPELLWAKEVVYLGLFLWLYLAPLQLLGYRPARPWWVNFILFTFLPGILDAHRKGGLVGTLDHLGHILPALYSLDWWVWYHGFYQYNDDGP